MNSKKPVCPACGSTDVVRHENISTDRISPGNEFSYKDIYYSCNLCGEEIDIFGETDKNYLIAQKQAQDKFVKVFIEEMAASGISMAWFERAFELPARTLIRWKEGNYSSSALALLRIIKIYPWIIKVAENKFDSKQVRLQLINAAANEFTHQEDIPIIPDARYPRKNMRGCN
jgi:transposase-like protein